MKHEQRVVQHVSGWCERMPTCVCGASWPCDSYDLQLKIEWIMSHTKEMASIYQHAKFLKKERQRAYVEKRLAELMSQ